MKVEIKSQRKVAQLESRLAATAADYASATKWRGAASEQAFAARMQQVQRPW